MALSVGIELVSSSARVTSVKSYKRLGVCDGHPDPKIGPQVYLIKHFKLFQPNFNVIIVDTDLSSISAKPKVALSKFTFSILVLGKVTYLVKIIGHQLPRTLAPTRTLSPRTFASPEISSSDIS